MRPIKQERESLTDQLRRFLVESGQSLGEVSRATGLDTSALSRFVRGERGVSMEGLDVLGDYLGLRLVKDRKQRKGG
jgi:hypothetical protein